MPVIEMYPEAFNHLRKVLHNEHEDLWAKVGYNMAHNQMQFILDMNAELDCICIPEMGIQEVCDKYLVALRRRKGKPATKSFELVAAEQQGRVGTASIFGTADDDAEREERHNWQQDFMNRHKNRH